MEIRRNAGLGAAAFTMALHELLDTDFTDCVGNVGSVVLESGVTNVVSKKAAVDFEFRFPDAGFGRAHGLHQRPAGELRGLADQRHLGQAFVGLWLVIRGLRKLAIGSFAHAHGPGEICANGSGAATDRGGGCRATRSERHGHELRGGA